MLLNNNHRVFELFNFLEIFDPVLKVLDLFLEYVTIMLARHETLELILCRYFNSRFHCFDAFVITAAFILDVVLRGVTEEAASLIVVLRLWRVFKIIEELSVGAQEQVEDLQHRIEDLEKGNRELEEKVRRLESGAC